MREPHHRFPTSSNTRAPAPACHSLSPPASSSSGNDPQPGRRRPSVRDHQVLLVGARRAARRGVRRPQRRRLRPPVRAGRARRRRCADARSAHAAAAPGFALRRLRPACSWSCFVPCMNAHPMQPPTTHPPTRPRDVDTDPRRHARAARAVARARARARRVRALHRQRRRRRAGPRRRRPDARVALHRRAQHVRDIYANVSCVGGKLPPHGPCKKTAGVPPPSKTPPTPTTIHTHTHCSKFYWPCSRAFGGRARGYLFPAGWAPLGPGDGGDGATVPPEPGLYTRAEEMAGGAGNASVPLMAMMQRGGHAVAAVRGSTTQFEWKQSERCCCCCFVMR